MYSVVILSKEAAKLRYCVGAVRERQVYAPVVVVDDGLDERPELPSGGESRGFRCFHPVEYLDGAKPFIYARNANIGIRACDGDVILLNDDALLETPGGFTVLEQAAIENPEYGVIAATTNNVGNLNQKPQGIGLREDPRMVCFVCVYIPRSTFDAVGMLDERFVGYGFDDDDFCLRVRRAGLKIGIHDGCFVDHGAMKSSFRGDPRTGGSLAQNLNIFVQKWGRHPL